MITVAIFINSEAKFTHSAVCIKRYKGANGRKLGDYRLTNGKIITHKVGDGMKGLAKLILDNTADVPPPPRDQDISKDIVLD